MLIHLNFINRSGDANNSSVVIFGQNIGASLEETIPALKVIENCGIGESRSFTIMTDEPVDTIWIGAASAAEQSSSSSADMVVEDATRLSLAGIISAGIVMTGGGDAAPLEFALADIVAV
jgi:hypothetical protein